MSRGRSRGRYDVGTTPCSSVLLITDKFMIFYQCVHVHGLKPVFIFDVGLSVLPYDLGNLEGAHFTPVTPGARVNFMPKESILNSGVNEVDSLMEAFLRGWKDEHIQRCQEREKHVLGLVFGNQAEPLMEGRGAGSQNHRFPHIHHLSRKYVPTPTGRHHVTLLLAQFEKLWAFHAAIR